MSIAIAGHKPRVLITGDSHTMAYMHALRRLRTSGAAPDDIDLAISWLGSGRYMIKPFSAGVPGGVQITQPEYAKQLAEIMYDPNLLAVGLSGNFHTARLLVRGEWHKYAPAEIANGEQPLSAAVLREVFMADQRHILAFVDQLQAANIKVFSIEAPRPFRHHPGVKKTRPAVWTGVDIAYRQFVTDELRTRNIDIISVPSACVDADGFMLDRFRSNNPADNHHGGAAFGDMMLAKTLDYLGSRRWALQPAD